MKPRKSILDPSFQYVPSHATDIRKTFERVSRQAEPAQSSSARMRPQWPRLARDSDRALG